MTKLVACVGVSAVLVQLLVSGCGSDQSKPAGSAPTESSERSSLSRNCDGPLPADTKLEECPYVFNGHCFSSVTDACECAGCKDTCIALNRVPTEVYCPSEGDAGSPSSGDRTDPPRQQ